MRQGIRTELDWCLIGAELARGDSNDQVTFFRAFVAECLTWGTHLQVERQLAFINVELTKNEKEVLSMITYEEAK